MPCIHRIRIGARALEFLQVKFLNILSFVLLFTSFSSAQAGKNATELPPSAFRLISIQVTGTQRYKHEEIARAAGLQLGQTVHEDDFRYAARRLGDTGAFTDVAYSFQYAPEGTKLELQVKDAEHFVPARFENLVWFSDQELLENLHAQVPLFNGHLPVKGTLPDDVSEALQALVDDKKIPARVDYLRVAHEDGPTEAFAFSVSGPRIVISTVEFSGTDATELPLLEAAAKRLRGAEYVRSTLRRQEDKNFLPVFLERGYLRAAFADPQAKVIQKGEDQTLVDVTFPVIPGPQYKLTQLILSGNKNLLVEDVRRLVQLKMDQPADAIQLARDVDSIKSLYGTRGYMDVSVVVAPELDDSQHTVKYRLTISEGDIYKMGDLDILGLDSRIQDRLQNNWTLLTGDTYNSGYTRRFVSQALKDVLTTGEWNTDIQETRNQKDKTVDVTLRFIQKY
jgi:outer membrane protein assembly factor BamA